MSVPRTLVWTPAPTAELQRELHRAGGGPAALVPVASGTVLLPKRGSGYVAAERLAAQSRHAGGEAAFVRWNGQAEVWSDGDRVGYRGPARRLVGFLRWLRLKPVRGVLDLPEDVAEVRGLVDEGRADAWITNLPDQAALPINTVLPVVPVTQGGAPLA
ncbi:hypothetical protein [Actinosynnema sp. NPDC020468]|uniref:hypothetical protein n=1 Tax=Actinosynnema sp. NPDC020468 TaxID=3154488 RepID=UPI0033EFACBF